MVKGEYQDRGSSYFLQQNDPPDGRTHVKLLNDYACFCAGDVVVRRAVADLTPCRLFVGVRSVPLWLFRARLPQSMPFTNVLKNPNSFGNTWEEIYIVVLGHVLKTLEIV